MAYVSNFFICTLCIHFRFLPTPAPPSDDEGDNDREDGDNPDAEGDNEVAEPEGGVKSEEEGEEVVPVEGDDEPGMWEETFKSHTDSKPYGGCWSRRQGSVHAGQRWSAPTSTQPHLPPLMHHR